MRSPLLLTLPLIVQFDDGCCAELGSAASRTKMVTALRRTLGTDGIDRREDLAALGFTQRAQGEIEAVGAKRHLCFLPGCSWQHSKKKAGRLSAPPLLRPSSD